MLQLAWRSRILEKRSSSQSYALLSPLYLQTHGQGRVICVHSLHYIVFRSPCFYLLQVCFAPCFHVALLVHLLGTKIGFAYGKLMCSFQSTFTTPFYSRVSPFSIDIIHITRDFTLLLFSGCFVVISSVFEDIEIKFHAFETLAHILRIGEL